MVDVSSQATSYFEAVDSRQHNVEDDGVELVHFGHFQPGRAIVGDGYGVVLLLQPLLEELGHPFFVLNDQHSHVSPLSARTSAVEAVVSTADLSCGPN